MTDQVWDAIVVGAGVIGCSAAYHLSKAGAKTLMLEQFPLPHTRGASSGHSRIIRNIYDSDCYAAMMPEAYRQWHQLEEDVGDTLFKQTGLLLIEGGETTALKKFEAVMTRNQLPFEMLDPVELRHHYPFFQYPDDHHALLDRSAGILIPSRCLSALQKVFLSNGGKIIDRTQVVEIRPGEICTLTSNNGETYRARHVAVCAGAWSHDLFTKVGLQHLPLKTMPGLHAYWKLRNPAKHNGGQDLPIIDHEMETPQGYWYVFSFPANEYPDMLKVAMRREPSHRYCHPDARDSANDDVMLTELSKYIARHMPELETTPSILEPCIYTVTPDQDFILDRHPDHRNILLAVGASHAFKHGPVMGKILSELVLDKKPSYDISPFSIQRFQPTSSAKL